jgi:hypothetical protein
MREWYRRDDRDTTQEMWSIVRKYNAAQVLLNGDDEDERDLQSAMMKRLARTARQGDAPVGRGTRSVCAKLRACLQKPSRVSSSVARFQIVIGAAKCRQTHRLTPATKLTSSIASRDMGSTKTTRRL